MACMVEYMQWRSDLTIQQDSFNEVDYAVLCELTYLDMSRVYDKVEDHRLRTIVQEILHDGTLDLKVVLENKDGLKAIAMAAQSARYGDLVVADHIDLYDPVDMTQFCAMTWELGNGSACVIFRGTDDTLAGWKEDFIASYTHSNSQLMASAYLHAALNIYDNVIVAGHSKGGNLALYAASLMPEEVGKKISHLYLLDSPGLCEDMFSQEMLALLDPYVTCVLPEDSVVGRIFEPAFTNRQIVSSTSFSLLAHELCTWELLGKKFTCRESFTSGSNAVNDLINHWLKTIPIEERAGVVEKLFGTIEKTGIHSLSELRETMTLEHLSRSIREDTSQILDNVRRTREKLRDQLSRKDIKAEEV